MALFPCYGAGTAAPLRRKDVPWGVGPWESVRRGRNLLEGLAAQEALTGNGQECRGHLPGRARAERDSGSVTGQVGGY